MKPWMASPGMAWQQRAYRLLQDQRRQQRASLDTDLVSLFSQ